MFKCVSILYITYLQVTLINQFETSTHTNLLLIQNIYLSEENFHDHLWNPEGYATNLGTKFTNVFSKFASWYVSMIEIYSVVSYVSVYTYIYLKWFLGDRYMKVIL